MEQEHKQLLDGIKKILNEIYDLKNNLDKIYLSKESWSIYHETINKDLNNLGKMVREFEKQVKEIVSEFQKQFKEIVSENHRQNIQHTRLSSKVGTIIGICGGLSGLGVLLMTFLRRLGE